MLTKVYAVLSLSTHRLLYLGPSIDRTARCLEPGTVYGWGESGEAARRDVARRAGIVGMAMATDGISTAARRGGE